MTIWFEGWFRNYYMSISNLGASISEKEKDAEWLSLPYDKFEKLLENGTKLKIIKEELISYYKSFYHLD